MLHHLHLGSINLFMDAKHGISPGNDEFADFDLICFSTNHFELRTSSPLEYVFPRLTILVSPSKSASHFEHITIQIEDFSCGQWTHGRISGQRLY